MPKTNMGSYFKFSAIYQTTLIKDAPLKVVSDPIKIEFFKGPRVMEIPIQVSRVIPIGHHQIAQNGKLTLNNGPFISITVRTDDSNPFTAKKIL
jgi:hypothetical protein